MNFFSDINQIAPQAWLSLLEKSPQASFFQSPDCYRFYASLSFLEPFVFAAGGAEDDLQVLALGYIERNGGLLARRLTARAIVQGGVLIAPETSADTLSFFLEKMTAALHRRNIVFVQIRNLSDYSTARLSFEQAGWRYQPHLNVALATVSSEALWQQMSASRRRQIRLSRSSGLQIETIEQEREVAEFYACLKKLYRTRVGTPLFPLEFFVKLAKLPCGKILAARANGRIIGGIALVFLPDKAVYEWFVCGSQPRRQHFYPSVALSWAGINFALEQKIPVFDFMGAGEADKPYGVRDFKIRFGGEAVERGRFLFVFSRWKYALGAVGVKILKKLTK